MKSKTLRVVVTIFALVFGFCAALAAKAQSADKSIYFEPLTTTVVPGEIAIAAMGFKGDNGESFGAYRLKLDNYLSSPGISILGWTQLSGQERIIIRILTDARLQPGIAYITFHVYDDQDRQYDVGMTIQVAQPLPQEFFKISRRLAVGSVPLYHARQTDGRVQALQTYQISRTFKAAGKVFVSSLEASGWEITNNSIYEFSGSVQAKRGDAEAFANFYTDSLTGERWITVGVTQ